MRKHLAGIIPVSGLNSDFNMPWHESLMPIGPNYLAIERSVAECAYAGCDSIWIVCGDDISPLIRYQVGEKVQDPVYNYRHFEYSKTDVKKPIRIYYVPTAVKDINKRDNLAWSAIFGAQTANRTLGSISRHLAPDKFYISWPYGYTKPSLMREYRKTIASKHVMLEYASETVKDNKYLSFTLDMVQIEQLVKESYVNSSGLYAYEDNTRSRLPKEERYSYRNFDLSKVFETLEHTSYEKIKLDEYFCLDNWKEYCHFLSSSPEIKKPTLLKYSEWNEIGVDDA